jgi:hypothetical protein
MSEFHISLARDYNISIQTLLHYDVDTYFSYVDVYSKKIDSQKQ